MLLLLRMTVAVVAAVGAAVLLGWAEPYPLRLGTVPAVVFAALALVGMVVTRTMATPRVRSSANPLREIILGAATAATWLSAMAFTYWLFGEVAYFPHAICDRNRAYVEQDIRDLEGRGQYRAAAAVGFKELDAIHTPEWTQALAEWTVRLLCRAAEETEGDAAQGFIDRALTIAERFHVPEDLPRLAKERLEGRFQTDGVQRQLDEAEAKLKGAAAEKSKAVEELNAACRKAVQGAAAAQDLRRQLAAAATLRQTALAEALVQLCRVVDQGVAEDLDGVRKILREALATATKEQLPLDDIKGVLGRVDARIAAQRSADLAPGTTGRVVRRQFGGAPGLLLVDVDLRRADGKPLLGLVSKDFVARQRGTTMRLAACPRRQTIRLNLTVAIDTSLSTQGEPLREAQAGVASLLQNLSPGIFVRLTSFSDRVRVLADWSQNPAAAVAGCRHLTADGGTALFVAADDAIGSFANVPGEKIAVIFSDGANSIPGPPQETLIAAARRNGVAVHFVALKQSEHDTQAIEQIARDTGGQTLLVHHATELVESFRTLAASLAEESYRLAVLDYDAAEPLSLQIGSAHAVRLTVEPSADAARVAAH